MTEDSITEILEAQASLAWPVFSVALEADGRIRQANQHLQQLLGENLASANFIQQFVDLPDRGAVSSHVHSVLNTGAKECIAFHVVLPSGEKAAVEWYGNRATSDPDAPSLYVGSGIRITQPPEPEAAQLENRRLHYLARIVQDLSRARSMDEISEIVKHASRSLAGSDGATFVLRDGSFCHYADEDAIAPLWKGKRFPLDRCISGWVMKNGVPAVIEDIYADDRIPHEAYRPTFVKSLAMIPVRSSDPIAALGNYWAEHYHATDEDLNILQALADSTSVAIENVRVYTELEERVQARTVALETANADLEAFSYSVSHDLRSPLRAISGFSALLMSAENANLSEKTQDYLTRISNATQHMGRLIDNLLGFARAAKSAVKPDNVNLTNVASHIARLLRETDPNRVVDISIADEILVYADPQLIRVVVENLLSNAWKYTGHTDTPRIVFGLETINGLPCCYVRDNGAGFDMAHADRLFRAFNRLHLQDDFPGTGVGLATVHRIITRHGGHIWAEAKPGEGATFYFHLPQKPESVQP